MMNKKIMLAVFGVLFLAQPMSLFGIIIRKKKLRESITELDTKVRNLDKDVTQRLNALQSDMKAGFDDHEKKHSDVIDRINKLSTERIKPLEDSVATLKEQVSDVIERVKSLEKAVMEK